MKRILAAAVAFLFAGSAFAGHFKGSAVLVAPLITSDAQATPKPINIIRLPVQAGKANLVTTTNLVKGSASWLVKGDKYYSLCIPNRRMVACAPIVATSIMQDIDVSAYAGPKGEPRVTFRIEPTTKLTPDRLAASINYFVARTNKQVAHFNRMVMIYAPPKTKASPLKAGISSALIAAGDGGSCSYDDFGDYDCSGGDSGYDGGGYDGGSYDWSGETDNGGGAEGPGSPSVPTFPSGNDNGDSDPCIDASGTNTCQIVVIIGQLPDAPDLMAMEPCLITPIGGICPRMPPVVGVDPVEQLPRGERPLWPQGACDALPILCSSGQIPTEPPPPLTVEEKYQNRLRQCYKAANDAYGRCNGMRTYMGEEWYKTCVDGAEKQAFECSTMLR